MQHIERQRGFTLIELIIVIAILAILLSIAVPAYQSYILRSKVRTVQTDLAALAVNVENHLQRKLAYYTPDKADTAGVTDAFPGWAPSMGADFVYSYDVGTPADGYTIKAAWRPTSDPHLRGCEVSLNSLNQKRMSPGCVNVMGGATW